MKLKYVSRIILVVLLTLLGFIYWHFSDRLHLLDSQLAKNRSEVRRRKFARSLAETAISELQQYESHTKAKLMKATSRGDFAVRTGEQFACSRLVTSTSSDLRLGVYVPPGHHHLCYSSSRIESRKEKMVGIDYSNESTRHNKIFLANVPEVIELRVQLGLHTAELAIQLIGKNDEIMNEDILKLPNPKLRHFISEPRWRETLSYPSELPLNDYTQQLLRLGRSRPLFDLASVEGWSELATTGEAEQRWLLRIWIESDAVPCMSAFNSHFRRSEINDKWSFAPRSDLRLVDKLFEPYSGGLVQKFRSDALNAKK